jgi:hypothetical protein
MVDVHTVERRSRRGTAALIVACLSLILSLIACVVAAVGGPGDSGQGESGRGEGGSSDRVLPAQAEPAVASASQLEAVAHLTLPPGTVLLSAAYSNGLETRLSAKFRLPRSELDAFVASAKFTAPLTPGLRAVGDGENVGGGNLWDPGAAKAVSGIDEEAPTADGTLRAVLFDLDAAGAVTVYLYAGRG